VLCPEFEVVSDENEATSALDLLKPTEYYG
jgi:hypothetical protein